MEKKRDEIVTILAEETGCTFGFAMFQAGFTPALLREAASQAHQANGEVMPSDLPGAFFMAIFVGWVAVGAADEMRKGASERSKKYVPAVMGAVRFILPPVILFATVYAFIAVVQEYKGAFGG